LLPPLAGSFFLLLDRRNELMLSTIRSVVTVVLTIASTVTFSGEVFAEVGRASWYSLTSRTASGERCDPGALTAAHRSLPFGTKVKVENLKNGKSVIVRINDRGPFIGGRIIDLTKAAAGRLGFISSGIAKVRLTVLQSS
jgi:rare lipoprotein A